MKLFRSMRVFFLALALSLVPASSFAGVLISVAIAPPALPVYEQPPCPQDGWMWTPGYWAYGPDGYYWVPGAWVPAPYVGALWTPGYWGWGSGFYMWHPGYWGRHVGYYGGINYGFGYMGIGFVGGAWRGSAFAYNTAVVRVNNVYIHNTYVDRTVVQRNTIVNDRRVSFNGGRGGINHAPTSEERIAARDQHIGRTSFQTQHVEAARNDHQAYFNNNHGRPQNLAVTRAPAANNMHQTRDNAFGNNRPQPNGRPQQPNGRPQQFDQPRVQPQQRPNYNSRPLEQQRVQPQQQPRTNPNMERPQQVRPEPQQRPQARPEPQRPQAAPRPEARPQQMRPESRPARPSHPEGGHPRGNR